MKKPLAARLRPPQRIHPNLTSGGSDLTSAKVLPANLGISFMGTIKGGAFDISGTTALEWLFRTGWIMGLCSYRS